MNKVLVKFSRDWADEFQCEGFVVVGAEVAEAMKEHFSTERTWYFGTNEGYDDEILIDSFEFEEISPLKAVAIDTWFPGGVGHVPSIAFSE